MRTESKPDFALQFFCYVSADVGFIEANKYLAIACSFLLGFGDACFNTQIFSVLGSFFKDNSAAAFAIFKFVQSFAAAAAFFYAQHAPLYYQASAYSIHYSDYH